MNAINITVNADIIAVAWLALLCGVTLLVSTGFKAPKREAE